MDKALQHLHGAKSLWKAMPTDRRADLLRECMEDLMEVSDEWVSTSCRAKGLLPESQSAGEEYVGSFMPIMRNLRLLRHAMENGGRPKVPSLGQRPNGQWVGSVFPFDLKEKLMFMGFEAEQWLLPGEDPSQGRIYREDGGTKVCLVLGAGNQGSIGPMDCLHKLFVENEVCILKMNPVNSFLGPYIERGFRALIEGNFMAVVYGGAEEGQYLCSHEQVESIHITGSLRTHDAIVWGPTSEEQERRKKEGTPANSRPITSELGCVDPILVVPGPWSDAQLDYHARQIVSMATHNAGFNCNAGNVVVLPGGWDRCDALVERVVHHLGRKPCRKAYYPGAESRQSSFLDHYSGSMRIGEPSAGGLPWGLLPDVPAEKGEYALTEEPFCGVLAFTRIDASKASEYLEKAPRFCNESIWGSLSCNLFIHPKTQKSEADAFESALEELRYGSIAVNAWSGVNYGLCSASWGAYPGNSLESAESGIGAVHNTYLFDHPQKSVVKAPFTINPTPAWFYDNKNLLGFGRPLLHFEAGYTWMGFLQVVLQAMRG
jgi:acyl-CoA reductase-like NAD-dependent aldehyde dehydrogenase